MTHQGGQGFAMESYLRAKAVWAGVRPKRRVGAAGVSNARSTPFGGGRDPRSLGAVLAMTAEDMGWSVELEQARLISEWPKLVGEITAPHTTVLELRDGMLIVQCDSTAWATELRRMRAVVMSRILEEYPEAGVEDLRFLAPGAPSWRHGRRVAPGRGPRDTYG